ncbi:hypothetical protein TNCV_687211 [Trichonephila clavipes]|nr:hypothetical protein TNCV_687211 [Trichonephila clavipes]
MKPWYSCGKGHELVSRRPLKTHRVEELIVLKLAWYGSSRSKIPAQVSSSLLDRGSKLDPSQIVLMGSYSVTFIKNLIQFMPPF